MASQSQSSNYSRSNNKTQRKRTTCFCGPRPVLRTSLTAENPRQRFWGCVNYQIMCISIVGEGCEYFIWADAEGEDPLPHVAKLKKKEVEGEDSLAQIAKLLKKKVAILKGKLTVAERNLWVGLVMDLVGWMAAILLLYDRRISPSKMRLP
ncbi:hypothetical protein PIB30_066722 [Stylosanthes scabra]|uniref:GRF-type domain-containing protein n=1 Tax=Stylosanthes scabra TaxID=79078 RepID=A0ABU6YMQ3_9FABA|nr:hypothetical protein [Stylosanthes scabra]